MGSCTIVRCSIAESPYHLTALPVSRMQSSGGSGVRSTTSSFANAGGGPVLIGLLVFLCGPFGGIGPCLTAAAATNGRREEG